MADGLGITAQDLSGRLQVLNARGFRSSVNDMRIADADVVIIDPFYKLLSADGRDGDKSAIDRAAGSGTIARDFGGCFTLVPHRNEPDAVVVETLLRNYRSPEPFTIKWEYNVFEARPDLPPEMETSLSVARNRQSGATIEDMVSWAEKLFGEPVPKTELRDEIIEEFGCGKKIRSKIIAQGSDDEADLWHASPVRLDGARQRDPYILFDTLYSNWDYLFIGGLFDRPVRWVADWRRILDQHGPRWPHIMPKPRRWSGPRGVDRRGFLVMRCGGVRFSIPGSRVRRPAEGGAIGLLVGRRVSGAVRRDGADRLRRKVHSCLVVRGLPRLRFLGAGHRAEPIWPMAGADGRGPGVSKRIPFVAATGALSPGLGKPATLAVLGRVICC